MSKKKLLIVGAGPDQVPAIKIAKELGFVVHSTDMNPLAEGFAFADHSGIASTRDKEATLGYAREAEIDGIMTLSSETAVPVIAYVAAQMGLPCISEQTAFLATNKNAMREVFQKYGVPAPRSECITTEVQALQFFNSTQSDVVIKPSDSSGQRGTTLVEKQEMIPVSLAAAIEHSTDGAAIIEEFVSGPEINVTAVVNAGDIKILSLSDRITAEPPHFGIAIEHAAPLIISATAQQKIIDVSIAAIKAVGLETGFAYPQVVLGPSGPRVIEIAARIPGGHMREVAMYLSGIDPIVAVIYQAMGIIKSWDELTTVKAYKGISVRFITALSLPSEMSTISSVTGLEEVEDRQGIKRCYCRVKAGDKIPPLNNSVARFGAIIAVADSRDAAREASKAAQDSIQFT